MECRMVNGFFSGCQKLGRAVSKGHDNFVRTLTPKALEDTAFSKYVVGTAAGLAMAVVPIVGLGLTGYELRQDNKNVTGVNARA